MAVDVAALYASLGLDYRDFVKGTKKVKKETRSLDKSFGAVGKTLKGVGAAMGIAFGGQMVIRGLEKITRIGVSFDQTMRQVKVISRATGDEFERLTAIAEKMGATTEYTSQQSGEALKFLSMAGLEAGQSIKALPQVLNLATAAQMDLATAADISTNIMTQMGLSVTELTHVNDALAAVQSTSNTTVLQAAEAFVYAGTKARQFGVDTIELSAMIGMLADSGIKATMAGTTLRQAMIKLLSPTAEAQDILSKYNIEIEHAEGGVRSFTDILYDLADSNIDVIETTELFGARAGNISAILDKGSDALKKYIGELRSMEGFAEDAATELRTGLWGSLKSLEASIEHLALVTFSQYDDALDRSIKVTRYYVLALADLIEHSEKIKDFFSFWFKVMKWMPGTGPVLQSLDMLFKHAEQKMKDAEEQTDETYKVIDEVAAAFTVKEEERQKERIAKEKKIADELEDIHLDWLDAKSEIGKTDYELSMLNLEKQYEAYKKVAKDTVALEEWKSDQIRMIELERTNELMALYRELYDATGVEEYAQRAIDAYQQILDAQVESWRAMGMTDDEALSLMESRMDTYVMQVYKDLDDIVRKEQRSANDRVNITNRMIDKQLDAQNRLNIGLTGTGVTSGFGEGTVIVPGAQPIPWLDYINRQENISDELENQTDLMETQTGLMREGIDIEKQRDAERRQEKFIEQSKQAFASFLEIGGSIDEFIMSLKEQGKGGPTGKEWWLSRYQELLSTAMSPPPGMEAEAVGNLFAFIPKMRGFMGEFGIDYSQFFSSLTSDLTELEGIYDLAGLLAGLGFGSTINEIEEVIEKLGMGAGNLGYTVDQLAASAIVAGIQTGLLAEDIGIDLLTAMGALSTEITASDGTVVSLDDFLSSADNLKDGMTLASGAVITLEDFLTNPTTGLEEAIDATGGESALLAGTMQGIEGGTNAAIDAINALIGEGDIPQGLAALTAFMSGLAGELGLTFGDAQLEEIIGGIKPPTWTQPVVVNLPWVEYEDGHRTFWQVAYPPTGFTFRTPSKYPDEHPNPPSDFYQYVVPASALGSGGLTEGLSVAGEIGPEWIVPTYEPQRSAFLDAVGASPEKIANALAKKLGPYLKERNISLEIDGKQLINVIIDRLHHDEEFIDSIRGAM